VQGIIIEFVLATSVSRAHLILRSHASLLESEKCSCIDRVATSDRIGHIMEESVRSHSPSKGTAWAVGGIGPDSADTHSADLLLLEKSETAANEPKHPFLHVSAVACFPGLVALIGEQQQLVGLVQGVEDIN